MKKIWIDILTPKQVMMFERLVIELSDSYELLLTTRDYKETNELLQLKGIKAVRLGKHGGATLEGKLNASLERMLDLSKLIQNEKPNLLISLASPEASRVSFGLNIPHICLNDIPEAEIVTKLTAPLSSLIISPKLIPKSTWEKYGIEKERIVQYNALDPIAWLKNFTPNRNICKELGIENEKPIITIRTEESHASYLRDYLKNGSIVSTILKELIHKKIDANYVIIPRYREQYEEISKCLNREVIIINRAVDGPSLLACSDIFIGGGGTMTLESALVGTPTINCRPIQTIYDNYAIKKGIVIKGGRHCAEKVEIILNDSMYKKQLKNKVSKLIKQMDDPIEVIKNNIDKLL